MQENSYANNISLPAMGEPLSFSGGMKTIALTHSEFIYIAWTLLSLQKFMRCWPYIHIHVNCYGLPVIATFFSGFGSIMAYWPNATGN